MSSSEDKIKIDAFETMRTEQLSLTMHQFNEKYIRTKLQVKIISDMRPILVQQELDEKARLREARKKK